MDQGITTQAQSINTQAQGMTARANREVVPQANKHVCTIAFNYRDFKRMNPPTLYGSKVEKDPQEFIDENYKILYAMGLTISQKTELSTYPNFLSWMES